MTQGSEFVFPNAARIDSVTATIGGGSIGDSIRAEIYLVSASGIVSSTPVATSPYTILTTTTGGVKTLGLSTIFTPTVGRKYVVALWHSARNADILLQYTANIYTVGKNWFRISNSVALGIWRHPESYGFDIAYMVRPHVICPVMTLTGTVVGSSGNNGSITVTSVPATGLSYAWSNGATTASITGLTAATYTVTATNTASGCSVSTAFSVQTVGTQNTKNIAAFAAFPNPTSDVLTVNYTLQNAERVHIQITNALGQILDNKDLPAAMQNSLQFNLAAYPSGTYFVQLQTSDAHLNERVLLQH
jgi:hypothetical protein